MQTLSSTFKIFLILFQLIPRPRGNDYSDLITIDQLFMFLSFIWSTGIKQLMISLYYPFTICRLFNAPLFKALLVKQIFSKSQLLSKNQVLSSFSTVFLFSVSLIFSIISFLLFFKFNFLFFCRCFELQYQIINFKSLLFSLYVFKITMFPLSTVLGVYHKFQYVVFIFIYIKLYYSFLSDFLKKNQFNIQICTA